MIRETPHEVYLGMQAAANMAVWALHEEVAARGWHIATVEPDTGVDRLVSDDDQKTWKRIQIKSARWDARVRIHRANVVNGLGTAGSVGKSANRKLELMRSGTRPYEYLFVANSYARWLIPFDKIRGRTGLALDTAMRNFEMYDWRDRTRNKPNQFPLDIPLWASSLFPDNKTL